MMGELFLTFCVDGKPRPKQSFRYTKHGGGFTSPVTKQWAELVAWHAKEAMAGKTPHPGPVVVELLFVIPQTKQKVDLDNLSKNVLDAMRQIVYDDDNQVMRLMVEKKYIDPKKAQPGVHIIVRNQP